MSTYFAVFAGAFVLTLMATPVVIHLAWRLSATDSPGVRKVHSQPIPRIGGVAIFLPCILLTTVVLFVDNFIGEQFRQVQAQVIAMMCGASFIFTVGLVDDLKGIRARYKLIGQIAAAIVVIAFGVHINRLAVTDFFVINLGWFTWPVTILWIVGITNAVNFIDGLDGLAAGICAVSCGVIAILSIYLGQPVMAIITLALLGSLLGFLLFNFNPAKVFMGDCGSLFLGFVAACSSVLCTAKTHALVGLALPFLALGIPIFDTLIAMLRRFLSRRSMLSADRSHFHHRLLALGVSHRQAVILAYLFTLLMTGLGMFMLISRDSQALVIFASVIVLLCVGFRLTGSVKLSETIKALQKKHSYSAGVKRDRETFERVQLYFSHVRTFDQWWQSVCFAAGEMGFKEISLPVDNRDGTRRNLQWLDADYINETGDAIEMTVPVPDRRKSAPLRMQIKLEPEDSLETASRRITLFTRLIDEHGIKTLETSQTALSSQVRAPVLVG